MKKVLGGLGGVIILLGLLIGVSEHRGSALRSYLYDEADPDQTLNVATVALELDRDPEKNRSKMVSITTDIISRHPEVELIVFGEASLGWFYSEPSTEAYHRRIAEPIPGPTTSVMAELAMKYQVYITFGMSELSGTEVLNAQLMVDPSGEIIAVQRKRNIKNQAFSPGQTPITFLDINGIRAGLVVCFDVQSEETTRLILEAQPDLLILSLADWTEEWDEIRFAYRYLSRRLGTWLVTANRYGNEDEVHWDGHLEIINPFGDVLASGQSREQFIYHELAFDQAASWVRRALRKAYSGLSLGYFVLRNFSTAYGYVGPS